MVEIFATHKENDYKYTNLSIFYRGSKALLTLSNLTVII